MTTGSLSRSGYQRVIGVDVAKDKLDLYDSAGVLKAKFDNDEKSILKNSIQRIDGDTKTLVVCESTATYHWTMMDLLHDHDIDVVVANPRQIRHFAEGQGEREKTDTIDARVRGG
ncbi:IS110 family transposase [Novipirellula aureliae]|uniref:IS110 family transposase n=1 Tax=Novipirellula aureliae TaxID=2527966 RepID=UPI0018CE8B54|nr:transposase [Novipirellula aureliae]